jgi:LmbE family N-acetylglucosaminyl deacetylase
MDSITRREVLTRAGRTGAAFALGLPTAAAVPADAQSSSTRKLKVVVAGGHPGDPEYGCGGTIARYSDLGHDVALLYLNNGEWPAAQGGAPAHIRMAEAAKACEILKARPLYAGQVNGHAVLDIEHFDEFRRILEAERPDVVFTQWPLDGHRDHRATSALAFDAWLHLDKKFALYYYEVSNGEDTRQFSPTRYVDISGMEPRKRAACYAHASQTPDRYYALQDLVARFRGVESGFERAEAFLLQLGSPYEALPAQVSGASQPVA